MAGETVAYLGIALEAAKKGNWPAAQANAEEGAKYAEIESRIEDAKEKD